MLLAAMALGVVILVVFGSRLRVSYRTALSGCARDDGTGGASGLFRWAGRIGIPTRLLEVPVWEAPSVLTSESGNCVLTMGNEAWSPVGNDLGPEEWLAMKNWIALGNALIVVTSSPESLSSTFRQDVISAAIKDAPNEPDRISFEWSVRDRPETSRAPVTSGGSSALTVDADGPRWGASPAPEKTSPGTTAKPPKPPPSTPPKGTTTTTLPPNLAVTPDAAAALARRQMAGDGRGGVLFRFPVGHGAVYVLLDDYAWTNAGLDHDQNARVLAGILGREVRPGGVLAIDEYRHGHGRTESFLTYTLGLPGASALIGLAIAWALAYVYGRNVRLRPVDTYAEPERRSAREYVEAVAQLYARARAAPLVVEAVARRLRQVARSSAEPPPELEAILRHALVYVEAANRPAVPKDAIKLVNQLIQLRKRFYGTRTVS